MDPTTHHRIQTTQPMLSSLPRHPSHLILFYQTISKIKFDNIWIFRIMKQLKSCSPYLLHTNPNNNLRPCLYSLVVHVVFIYQLLAAHLSAHVEGNTTTNLQQNLKVYFILIRQLFQDVIQDLISVDANLPFILIRSLIMALK